ncbi:ClpXP protease specificity-enhancing factor SspB [Bradyrhizobium sp. TZ2]
MLLPLLAAIAAASPAAAEPCSTAASRNAIAETLRRAAEDRPVNVTFQTRAEGVKISNNLKSKYSDEMTIILQNEFKQLSVKDDRFEVVLWPASHPERLIVPFAAIRAFWDNAELKCK